MAARLRSLERPLWLRPRILERFSVTARTAAGRRRHVESSVPMGSGCTMPGSAHPAAGGPGARPRAPRGRHVGAQSAPWCGWLKQLFNAELCSRLLDYSAESRVLIMNTATRYSNADITALGSGLIFNFIRGRSINIFARDSNHYYEFYLLATNARLRRQSDMPATFSNDSDHAGRVTAGQAEPTKRQP